MKKAKDQKHFQVVDMDMYVSSFTEAYDSGPHPESTISACIKFKKSVYPLIKGRINAETFELVLFTYEEVKYNFTTKIALSDLAADTLSGDEKDLYNSIIEVAFPLLQQYVINTQGK